MKAHAINAAALAIALTGSGVMGQFGSAESVDAVEVDSSSGSVAAEHGLNNQVDDADGTPVRTANYERIVSLNPVADHLLLRLVEPERILAISSVTRNGHPDSWRFGRAASVDRSDSLERVLDLRPDLIVASPFVDVAKIARFRAEGIQVFNLGEMRGMSTTMPSIDVLGQVLRVPNRARHFARSIDRDLIALRTRAAQLVASHGPFKGLYLSVYGDAFFGGTQGTSYGDVLGLAGIDDVAQAAGYVDWPQYTAEQILSLDPEFLVTRRGMAKDLRAHPVLSRLRAVQAPGRILQIDPAYDGDAGLGVIEAASDLQGSLEALLPARNPHAQDSKHD